MGYKAQVLDRPANDPYKFEEVYSDFTNYTWLNTPYCLGAQAVLKSLFVDILHIHNSPIATKILKNLFPFKKVILHCHDNIMRGKWEQHRRNWEKADAIIVTNRTLLVGSPKNTILLNNPVDTDRFKDYGNQRVNKAFLMIKAGRSKIWKYIKPVADRMSREFNVEFETWFADQKKIHHAKMPSLLNQWEYVMDINHGWKEDDAVLSGTFSTLGLQALACKCKVITPWSDKVFTEVPERNKPENVIKNLDTIYSAMFED